MKHEGIPGNSNKQEVSAVQENVAVGIEADTSGAVDTMDDRAPVDAEKEDNTDLYSLKNFSV